LKKFGLWLLSRLYRIIKGISNLISKALQSTTVLWIPLSEQKWLRYHCFHLQGVQMNTGIERRLEYRLWFPIINKWYNVQKKDYIKELSKMWSTFFVPFKLTDVLNIWTVLLIFNLLESELPNFSVNFGNPEPNSFRCSMFLLQGVSINMGI